MILRTILRLLTSLVLLLALATPSHAIRLFTTGYEENNAIETTWTSLIGSAPTFDVTTVHSGTYSLKSTTGGTASGYRRNFTSAKTSNTLWGRFYFQTNDETPAADTIFFQDLGSGSAAGLRLTLLTTGAIKLTNVVSTTTATTSATISPSTWYRVEFRHLISDTVGELELRLYAGESATLLDTLSITAEDTKPTDIQLYDFAKTTATAVTFYYDDIAINDETGSDHNTWAGPGKIYLLTPDSDVSITWEDDDLVSPATFANVDDVPGTPDDATTYNEELVNLNSIDRLGLTDLGAEVPATAVLSIVNVQGRPCSNQTSTASMRLKLWDESGTLTTGPTIAHVTNGCTKLGTTGSIHYDATGKTKANLSDFNVGYENLTDLVTRPRRFTAVWVNVEWTEASGSALQSGSGFLGGILK